MDLLWILNPYGLWIFYGMDMDFEEHGLWNRYGFGFKFKTHCIWVFSSTTQLTLRLVQL